MLLFEIGQNISRKIGQNTRNESNWDTIFVQKFTNSVESELLFRRLCECVCVLWNVNQTQNYQERLCFFFRSSPLFFRSCCVLHDKIMKATNNNRKINDEIKITHKSRLTTSYCKLKVVFRVHYIPLTSGTEFANA